MSPTRQVRISLAASRLRGWDFDTAWCKAISSLPRGRNLTERIQMQEWRRALTWSRPYFESAYYDLTDPPSGYYEPASQTSTGHLGDLVAWGS